MSQAYVLSALSRRPLNFMYSGYSPPLWIALVVVIIHIVLRKHVLGKLRRIELAAAKDARRRRVHHWRRSTVEAVR